MVCGMEPQANHKAVSVEPQPPKRSRRCWIVWGLVLLLVVYPLSSGPVARLWSLTAFSDDAVLGLYTPLIYLAFYLPGFRRVFTWYLGLWKTSLGT